MIRTRAQGQVAAMIPCRLCCMAGSVRRWADT